MQEFPHITKAEWLAKVEKDLKGKPLDGLNWEVEGETFTPFWHQEDQTMTSPVTQKQGNWKLGVNIKVEDLKSANHLALAALTGGAEYLHFKYDGSISKKDIDVLLDGVYREIIDFCVEDSFVNQTHIFDRQQIPVFLMQESAAPGEKRKLWLTITDDYFNSIAFLRAVRLCLQQINHEHGLSTDCEIGVLIKATDDNPDYQKIKNTSQAMAAIIGGADILIIEPINGEDGSSFERRVARNVQNVLREEAYLHRVADPAAGSYYIEALTDTFARKIWAEFQQLLSE